MPKIKTTRSVEDSTPVMTWCRKSSKAPLVGGATFDYVVQLNQNGTVSCNCPGWRFVKKGQPRGCKHTNSVGEEATRIYTLWKAGDTAALEAYATPQVPEVASPGVPAGTTKKSNSKIGYVRYLEI